ncbi:hypothetical protein TK11N_23010 [Tetragenococcus koreensis]|uniref:Uncharacterized protein n=1 Tax=Tetragenococcus koreensis TaxID=290335 RepID=A0AAN4UDH2_9ENTE|nr:hypothetical protein TK11N_23010 [Tetragenococcus koreensis]GEQ52952.1 hypothetical protein TK12N_22960 [Tetragenococcus koreensis]GEQ55442.1 hypothetical protein TK2N_22860 [Tetragenococcus koreensis]GEQ57927.1 hypothetical protein TK4N_22700 [Tetragenococcus koreensis]GEQ60434.1 hypothetical protein TK6N_22730 [Tetragenococcus koreensis]
MEETATYVNSNFNSRTNYLFKCNKAENFFTKTKLYVAILLFGDEKGTTLCHYMCFMFFTFLKTLF